MASGTVPPVSRRRGDGFRVFAYGLLIVAVAVRFYHLDEQSLWLDEIWGVEIMAGHGAEHLALPVGQLIDSPPDLTRAPRPAWAVWTHMDRVTGPPGGYLLQRAWAATFGTSAAGLRSLSAVCSAGAVAVLFLAVRASVGTEPALWAAALMAVAGPQVRAAQDARPYGPLVLLGTVALWLVARLVARPEPGRRTVARTVGLSAVLLGLLLTHYFAVAMVAAVGLYGIVGTRGLVRRRLVIATSSAALAFAVCWGPFMWRQRAAFSPTDPAASFLHELGPGHAAATVRRAVMLPASLLVDARPTPTAYVVVGVLLWATVLRWARPVPLWPLVAFSTVAMLGALDLSRSTAHLRFVRYSLLVGPVVYASVGAATTGGRWRWAGRAMAAVAVGWAAWSLPRAYATENADWRALGRTMAASVRPGEPVVFAGPGAAAQVRYLCASFYAGPPSGGVLLLDRPAGADLVRRTVGVRPVVWLVADPEVRLAREWLPGYHLAAGQSWPEVGSLLRMEPDP